ncbi:MAG: NAD(P)-dependent alcohol dehydrogenase [Myxococcota bacterium]
MTRPSTPSTMRGLVLDPSAEIGVRLREDLTLPTPKKGEIRVQVAYSSVNGHEFELARNPLVRLTRRLRRAPGEVQTGLEFAGVVDADGASFSRGERVFGYVDMIAGWKPHGEFLAIPEAYVARAPEGVPLARAAALPMSAQTALVALREVAGVQPGQHTLILGASGGVGVMAVQIARILGAEVTAVASAKVHERLADLGATQTVDYRQTPLEHMTGSFDAILDFSRTAYLSHVRHLLADGGMFIPADPLRNIVDVTLSRRAKWLMVDRGDRALLEEIARWVEQGRLEPIVDEVFEFARWPAAVTRSHERGRLGRTMLHFG